MYADADARLSWGGVCEKTTRWREVKGKRGYILSGAISTSGGCSRSGMMRGDVLGERARQTTGGARLEKSVDLALLRLSYFSWVSTGKGRVVSALCLYLVPVGKSTERSSVGSPGSATETG
jgi:hypothetical protein